jgi:hypothetical protein
MGGVKLVGEIHEKSPDVSLREEVFDGYEQRMTRWGCHECGSFEKRVFRTGLRFEELDAYFICRSAGELVDLIGERTVCPKTLYGQAA